MSAHQISFVCRNYLKAIFFFNYHFNYTLLTFFVWKRRKEQKMKKWGKKICFWACPKNPGQWFYSQKKHVFRYNKIRKTENLCHFFDYECNAFWMCIFSGDKPSWKSISPMYICYSCPAMVAWFFGASTFSFSRSLRFSEQWIEFRLWHVYVKNSERNYGPAVHAMDCDLTLPKWVSEICPRATQQGRIKCRRHFTVLAIPTQEAIPEEDGS